MPTHSRPTHHGMLLAGAVAVYLVLAGALISVGPGPHYDEAMFQVGAVHMLNSPEVPTFPHPAYGWVRVVGRFWPVMMMPYAGAVSFYLLLPVFALVGPGLVVGRVYAALLGALGLWGLGRLVNSAAGTVAAVATVLVLAIHPGYLSNTVFNESGFAYWMAVLGAVCLALRSYVVRRTAMWAAAVGFACGLGVWTRLNFAWLLSAVALGALVGFGRRAVPSGRHMAAAAAGTLLGSAPLIGWVLLTRGGATLDYMASFDAFPRSLPMLLWRLRLLSAALLYDDEHRHGMWEGPPLPVWQVAFVCIVIVAAAVAAFVGGQEETIRRAHRVFAASLVALSGVMIWTRLPVREHHFLTLVPLAAVAVVLAAVRLLSWRPASRLAVAAVAALYLATALYWDWSAWHGLRATGGTGMWSDATVAVARYLDARHAPRVAAFDWGFHTSIYFVTSGRVKPQDLFWQDPRGPDAPVWRREIVPGRLYLIHSPLYQSPTGLPATAGFRQALARSSLSYSRLVFNDGLGRPHTELIEIHP